MRKNVTCTLCVLALRPHHSAVALVALKRIQQKSCSAAAATRRAGFAARSRARCVHNTHRNEIAASAGSIRRRGAAQEVPKLVPKPHAA